MHHEYYVIINPSGDLQTLGSKALGLVSRPRGLTLIVPRAWEIGYTQPCIKCQGSRLLIFFYFWSRKTLPYTHLEATSYIPQQGQSLHI